MGVSELLGRGKKLGGWDAAAAGLTCRTGSSRTWTNDRPRTSGAGVSWEDRDAKLGLEARPSGPPGLGGMRHAQQGGSHAPWHSPRLPGSRSGSCVGRRKESRSRDDVINSRQAGAARAARRKAMRVRNVAGRGAWQQGGGAPGGRMMGRGREQAPAPGACAHARPRRSPMHAPPLAPRSPTCPCPPVQADDGHGQRGLQQCRTSHVRVSRAASLHRGFGARQTQPGMAGKERGTAFGSR